VTSLWVEAEEELLGIWEEMDKGAMDTYLVVRL
jgi:hypothetical protein